MQQNKNWEKQAIQQVEFVFWSWDLVIAFTKLRSHYGRNQKYVQIRDLPDELTEFICNTKARISKYIPERTLEKQYEKSKDGTEEVVCNMTVKTSELPLAVGHFGMVFDYKDPKYKSGAVLKLIRWEHVLRSINCYSFMMEMIISILIQSKNLNYTPQLHTVVRTPKGDLGLVMEKLQITLSEFFLSENGLGATNYKYGLLVLLEIAHIIGDLQSEFEFRHRDLRMRNIMLTSAEPKSNCVKIIDLGQSSIVFQNRSFSAYSGTHFEKLSEDFDLGFLFADMLIQFEQHNNQYRYQLEHYEPYLLPLVEGIYYENLIGDQRHLSKLASYVKQRPPSTKKFSTPAYVCEYLYSACQSLKSF